MRVFSIRALIFSVFIMGSVVRADHAPNQAPGGYPGGGFNPGNWNRWLYTGDPSAADETYNAATEAGGESIAKSPVHQSPNSPLFYVSDKDFWKSFGEGLKREYTSAEGVHTMLDGVGLIPVVGDVLGDGTNGVLYLLEGDKINAGVSWAAVIPIVGDVAKGPRAAARIVKLTTGASAAVSASGKVLPNSVTKKLVDAVEKLDELRKQGFHGKKPKYENPGTHDPSNTATFVKGKAVLPDDAESLFRSAIPSPDGATWWARSSNGDFHRFSGANGKVHWNGATGSAGQTGRRTTSIKTDDVPKYVKDRFTAQDNLAKLGQETAAP